MKILVTGCGAVGLAVAASLIHAGADTFLLARGETYREIKENGIVRRGVFEEIKITPEKVKIYNRLTDIKTLAFDCVLISIKTTSAAELSEELGAYKGLLSPDGKIVLLQNGFGNEAPYLRFFQKEQICSAYISIGFRRPLRYVSEVTVFSAPMQLGSLFEKSSDTLEDLAEAVTRGGIPCKVTDDIGKYLWAKMLYNCTLNPLGAILNTSYGGLARCEDSVQIMKKVIEEIYDVIKAAGYHTFWPSAEVYQDEFFKKILPPTYGHRSSTLQDVERKIKTEIDSLNGVIVRLGRQYGLDVSCNRMICQLIRAKESLY